MVKESCNVCGVLACSCAWSVYVLGVLACLASLRVQVPNTLAGFMSLCVHVSDMLAVLKYITWARAWCPHVPYLVYI